MKENQLFSWKYTTKTKIYGVDFTEKTKNLTKTVSFFRS